MKCQTKTTSMNCNDNYSYISWHAIRKTVIIIVYSDSTVSSRWNLPGISLSFCAGGQWAFQLDKLMAKSHSHLVNLPGAWPLTNPLIYYIATTDKAMDYCKFLQYLENLGKILPNPPRSC